MLVVFALPILWLALVLQGCDKNTDLNLHSESGQDAVLSCARVDPACLTGQPGKFRFYGASAGKESCGDGQACDASGKQEGGLQGDAPCEQCVPMNPSPSPSPTPSRIDIGTGGCSRSGYDTGDFICFNGEPVRKCNGLGACFKQNGKSSGEVQDCENAKSKGTANHWCGFMDKRQGLGDDLDPDFKSNLWTWACPEQCQTSNTREEGNSDRYQAIKEYKFDAVYIFGDGVCAARCKRSASCKQSAWVNGKSYCKEIGKCSSMDGCHHEGDYIRPTQEICKILFPSAC